MKPCLLTKGDPITSRHQKAGIGSCWSVAGRGDVVVYSTIIIQLKVLTTKLAKKAHLKSVSFHVHESFTDQDGPWLLSWQVLYLIFPPALAATAWTSSAPCQRTKLLLVMGPPKPDENGFIFLHLLVYSRDGLPLRRSKAEGIGYKLPSMK